MSIQDTIALPTIGYMHHLQRKLATTDDVIQKQTFQVSQFVANEGSELIDKIASWVEHPDSVPDSLPLEMQVLLQRLRDNKSLRDELQDLIDKVTLVAQNRSVVMFHTTAEEFFKYMQV